jgi:hypothetical protein
VTFRIGLIGSGNISDTHARAALAVDDVSLEAHWGRNVEAIYRSARSGSVVTLDVTPSPVSSRTPAIERSEGREAVSGSTVPT